MSKDKKRVFKNASLVEYKSLERYFEEMALKGWLVEKMGFGMTFRKIEPQAFTFNVALLTPKTMLDWPDSEEASTYDEFCKSAGWKLATESQVYRIYYRLAEIDGPPIYTDAEDIYKTIKKAFFKSEFILMLLPLLYMAMAYMNFKNIRYDVFTSNLSVFNLISPFVITLIMWLVTMPSLYWLIKNADRLKKDKPLFYYSSTWVKNKYRFQSVILTLYILLLIGAMIYDPYNHIKLSVFVVALLPMALIFMFVWLFKKFIQKKAYPLIAKIGILVLAWALSMGIGMTFIFAFFGSDYMDGYDDEDIKVETNRLTFEELGITGLSELQWRSVDSSLFVPLSYEYVERIEEDLKQDSKSIYVESMHMASENLRDWAVEKVLKEEEERFLEEVQYKPDLENYVKEITGYDEFGVKLYNLSESGYRVMVVKDKDIYLIMYSDLLKDDILEKALIGLFD